MKGAERLRNAEGSELLEVFVEKVQASF